jgi:K+-sensing histidine kinase KdpD
LGIDQLRTRYHASFILAVAAGPLLLAAILASLRGHVPNTTAILVLVLFIVVIAASGDRLGGIVAALSSGVWFDFFLTAPYHQFVISNPNDIENAVLLVVVGAGVSELALWGRRQQGRAGRRAGYLEGVLRTAELVAGSGSTQEEFTRRVADQIQEVLLVDGCRFVALAEPSPQTPRINHDGSVSRRGVPVEVERDGLPTDDEIALLVRRRGVTCGHYMITAATHIVRPSLEQRKVAVLLADQAANFVTGQA